MAVLLTNDRKSYESAKGEKYDLQQLIKMAFEELSLDQTYSNYCEVAIAVCEELSKSQDDVVVYTPFYVENGGIWPALPLAAVEKLMPKRIVVRGDQLSISLAATYAVLSGAVIEIRQPYKEENQ